MSGHAPSHGSASWSSIFDTPKSWFATKSPGHLNPLSSIDATADNLVKGVVKNTTWWAADILNPLWVSLKNAGSLVSPSAYRSHGWKNIPKAITGVMSHALDSVNNLVAGSTVRWLDHVYTNGITNSVIDITSGTTDRIPGVGKMTGNAIKAVNVIPAAPIRFLARIWEKTIDPLVDWMKKSATIQGKGRHITTSIAHTSNGSHH
jgi:hypothetical protein